MGYPGAAAHGGTHVPFFCSWFPFLRVAEAASILVADVRGEKALGFLATKRGIIGCRWRRWSKWFGAWRVACGITQEGGMGTTRWCLEVAGF